MRTIDNRTGDMMLNVLNVILGTALFLAPLYLGLSEETVAARNAFISGGAITLVAMLALRKSYDWEEYLNVALGIWVAFAPWALGFADVQYAALTHVFVGLTVAILAGIELRRLYRSPEAYSV